MVIDTCMRKRDLLPPTQGVRYKSSGCGGHWGYIINTVYFYISVYLQGLYISQIGSQFPYFQEF